MALSWSSLCRLCINSEECNNALFNLEGESKGILQLIEKYLCIYVTPGDDLPTSVCRLCCDKLTLFNNFATECERAQSFLEAHKNFDLQDDFHLQYLKSEFEFGVNAIKIKCEQNEEESFPNTADDDMDYVPLSDLRDIKLKGNEKKSSSKKKRGRPRKKVDPEDLSENKVFSELEKFMEGELIDNSTGNFESLSSRFRKCKEIKSENLHSNDDEDGISLDDNECETGVALRRAHKKLKGTLKQFSFGVSKSSKRMNYGIFKFDCHVCEKTFGNFNALRLHTKRTHKTHAKVLCICFKYLKTRRSLLQHIALHDPSKKFKCDSCDKVYSSEAALSAHALYHRPREEHPFVCCKCAKRFTTARILKTHELTHIPREERFVIPCDLCENKFATKGALLTHKRVIHDKLKPFVCDLCGHAFGTKSNLEEHRVRHLDVKNFVCNECNKSFKTKGAMVRHMDTHGDTAYQCPRCPMLLNSRRTLRNHLFVHDPRAKHSCPFCGKEFKRRKDVKCHMKLHTGERPYTCPWCPRAFTNGSNCRIHKRRMHPQEFQIAETHNPFAPTLAAKVEPKKVIHATFRNNSAASEHLSRSDNPSEACLPETPGGAPLPVDLKPAVYPIVCK